MDNVIALGADRIAKQSHAMDNRRMRYINSLLLICLFVVPVAAQSSRSDLFQASRACLDHASCGEGSNNRDS